MTRSIFVRFAALLALTLLTATTHGQQENRPYRLESVDLKQRVIWGAECRLDDGTGLAFGGQDQDAADGRPHTRVLKDGKWIAIYEQLLHANKAVASQRSRYLSLRNKVQSLLAYQRRRYLNDGADEKAFALETEASANQLLTEIDTIQPIPRFLDVYSDREKDRLKTAATYFAQAKDLMTFDRKVTPNQLNALYRAQIQFELAAAILAAEPPARAMDCGKPRRRDDNTPRSRTIVHDRKTGLYLIFGGDHLDYLTNDTWVFDPKVPRWELRIPKGAPPPRANHRLEAKGDGTVTLTGGYTYSSSTGYISGQYVDLNDGTWTYNIEKNEWTGGKGKLVSPDSRTYREGPFHPDYYLQGDKPDAAAFQKWLKEIPENTWVATNPPYRPRLNRDWGTARIDPDRDMILRWSGGHSAHGGTDVPHFHFATNRWELPFPVEFPLGQLYSNTSYPNGFNFNMRPWITGHTYQNYAYDPPSKKMIKAGRPRHFYVYDPDLGDWIGRGEKPKAMQYNSCFYTLTCAATPHGVICWDKYGRVHRYDSSKGEFGSWIELELTGDKLPGAYVDNSTIVYDSQRDRVLMFNTGGYRKPYLGDLHALDLKSKKVTRILPANAEIGARFNNIDKSVYDATNDVVLIGTYVKADNAEEEGREPMPAFDCKTNKWITLDVKYELGKRVGRMVRLFPHTRSDGLMFDPKRKLIWGTDTNSQVYVLRLKVER